VDQNYRQTIVGHRIDRDASENRQLVNLGVPHCKLAEARSAPPVGTPPTRETGYDESRQHPNGGQRHPSCGHTDLLPSAAPASQLDVEKGPLYET
jgi:hypothetical protein